MTTLENQVENILIFKTNVRSRKDLKKLAKCIEEDQRLISWNLDIEDIDKVLRIVASDISAVEVIYLLKKAGFSCEELQD